jgi:pyruvate formate-lyase activating enzyme-like uncharacterized protein
MQRRIVRTPYHSWRSGPLAEGCRQCVKGEKLVLFVTGVCPAKCFYCPISEEKKQKDVQYANERPIKSDKDLLQEARDCAATGAGSTGGDPLARLERTCNYIRLLKKEFGEDFHVHLYTPLNLVTEERLKRLSDVGLDEIRFHPDLLNSRWWSRIGLAGGYPWKIGVEIPVLPDKVEETKRLLEYIDRKIDFLNLNELEISDLNEPSFARLGYRTKAYGSYGVAGSQEAAMELMRYAAKLSYPVHYCPCRLKDLVQMGNRLKRRAHVTRLPFDVVDEDGLVTRGAIYFSLVPGYGYEKSIETLSEEARLKELFKLKKIKAGLVKNFKLGDDELFLDERKPRLLVSARWLRKNHRKVGHPCAVVTEYPTYDSFPIEIELLRK